MHCKTITRAKAEHGRWDKFQYAEQSRTLVLLFSCLKISSKHPEVISVWDSKWNNSQKVLILPRKSPSLEFRKSHKL